jgi:hypothetical protein
MLPAIAAARLGTQLVAGLGVSKIVADIVKNNVSVVTTADAIKVWTGSLVIGSMIVEQSSNHIERVYGDVFKWSKTHKIEVIETPPTTE